MKNVSKTSKWVRWIAAGAFGIMLVLNIMVSLDFKKDKVLPSLTMVELGNRAFAQGEGGTATVPCKDVQEFGTGGLTARICADGQTVICAWKSYMEPANDGTCTL